MSREANKNDGNDDDPDNVHGSDAGDEGRRENEEEEGKSERKKRKRKRKRSGKASADDPAVDEHSSSPSPSKKAAESNQPSNSSGGNDAVSRTVYLEGLPYDATEEQVREFFGGLEVTSLRLPKWQDTGRLRGYGHAELATKKDYERALAKSGQCIPGYSRYLQIRPANPPKPIGGAAAASSNSSSSEPSKTLLLKNLSYDATEDDVRLVMEKFGPIAEGGIRIARHNRNKQSRGFGYVEFRQLDSAVRAVKAAVSAATNDGGGSGGIVICHRPCLVDYDHGTVRKSFRTETGRLWQKRYGGKGDA